MTAVAMNSDDDDDDNVNVNDNEVRDNDHDGRGPFASTMSKISHRPLGLNLHDEDLLDEDEDADLLFLARRFSPGGGGSDELQIPLRRTGGVSWDVDMG